MILYYTECNSSMYPRPPSNSGIQTFPSPFLPGIAVNYLCATNFTVMGEQTFMCNGNDGNFTPTTPPNCTQGKLHILNIKFD